MFLFSSALPGDGHRSPSICIAHAVFSLPARLAEGSPAFVTDIITVLMKKNGTSQLN